MLGAEREWLFLNVHPGALTDPYLSRCIAGPLKRLDLPPRRIVLEVLEQRGDLERLAGRASIPASAALIAHSTTSARDTRTSSASGN